MFFFSTVLVTESFRSRWGSLRALPVFSSQTSPTAAPQVVHGTESICFTVRSLVFTYCILHRLTLRRCPILHTLNHSAKREVWTMG